MLNERATTAQDAFAVCDDIARFRVLDVPISVIDMATALASIDRKIANGQGGYICIRDTHGVMVAQDDPHFREIHEQAFMVTPDGMPLVWLGRLDGHSDIRRVCGPDLVDALCKHSLQRGYRHYFFGGSQRVADALAKSLSSRYPGLELVGCESPPFSAVTLEPNEKACSQIRAAEPDIVWIGLGSPKQEYWMHSNAPLLPGVILIGVGAAFDFHAGTIRRAPVWMQKNGVEWLYRLFQEPTRLWRRYLILAPRFLVSALWEKLWRQTP